MRRSIAELKVADGAFTDDDGQAEGARRQVDPKNLAGHDSIDRSDKGSTAGFVVTNLVLLDANYNDAKMEPLDVLLVLEVPINRDEYIDSRTVMTCSRDTPG